MWFMLLWIVFSYFSRMNSAGADTTIPYSVFRNQVHSGNVNSVTIKGNDISGVFAQPYHPTEADGDTTTFRLFSTVIPSVGDTGLLELLETNNVTVQAQNQGTSWLPYLLIILIPWILLIGYSMYASRKMQGQGRGGIGGIFGIGKSTAKKFQKSNADVTYGDVAGLDNAKESLKDIIAYLRDPSKFVALGADIPKGILLVGPPGNGKTLLARATAGEAGVPFYSISGSEFIEIFVGVGASRVRDLFENAKREAPSIIFIDEIDSVGRARGTGIGGGHDEREQTLNQILSEMDGFEEHESVVVIAATNRPDVLDPALTRPGRFDRQVTLELPQKRARLKILQIHSRDVPLDTDVNLENLATRSVGFSGADLKNLVNEAALLAGRKSKHIVSAGDFEEAWDTIIMGAEHEEMLDEEEKRIVAYHESGHALAAILLAKTDPLQKVTIIPRGRSLGATEQIPIKDRHNLSRSYLLDRISVMLGGRAAEKLIFDELTNGASQDLKQATQLARHMVAQWGMSERLGPITFRVGEEHVFLGQELAQPKDFSEHTARIIDEEIHRIVSEMEERSFKILSDNRENLVAIAETLIENETLSNADIEKILRKEPLPVKDAVPANAPEPVPEPV
ncbi:MAG: ATP-dependent zinc metalloprotease FtsH [Candidatus Latescibacterota bacterium]